MSLIFEHPDVQAMLLRMKALTAAARAICYVTAHAIDMSRRGKEAERARYGDRASLLTPVAKAFATDIGVEVASLGIQVHGGMGFIEETGAAQHLRDVRVFSIYEGTNGIQATHPRPAQAEARGRRRGARFRGGAGGDRRGGRRVEPHRLRRDREAPW